MNRAFYYLYFLIVSSVVILGLGIDALWREYSPREEYSIETPFFQFLNRAYIEQFKEGHPEPETLRQWLSQTIGAVSTQSLRNYELLDLNDFATSNIHNKLSSGQIVTVRDGDKNRLNYLRLEGSSYVVSLSFFNVNDNNPFLYNFFIIVFYASIALVVFLWVWPLSRDLRKMQLQTQKVGIDGLPVKIEINKRSAVYELAKAYNRMTKRIFELVKSHQEMTYAVSHELRTPLARMKFALEMAQETKDEDSIRSQLVSIKIDVSDMDSLVKQLLAYAGFEQDSGHLNIQPGDMPSMMESLIGVLNQQNPELNISFQSDLAGKTVYCEWQLMERAIINLLQNAIRYAEKDIVVGLEAVKVHGMEFVQIHIEDDGIGIPENERERVFSAFVRLRNQTNSKKGGFGLGLSIVYRIMQWHKGRAYVESSRLGGARFILIWPLNYVKKPNNLKLAE